MPRSRTPGLPDAITGGKKICPLCWHPADKRDATINGYHIECSHRAAEIITDALHSSRGLVYIEWYKKRWPGRPIPNLPPGANPEPEGE